ncbi:hypothetical protein FZC66_10240 [Priestia megaterium]|nr:hypothetical protein FZC66_10240 [Priestia megaterium]
MKTIKQYIEELGNQADILTVQQANIYFEKLAYKFPFTNLNKIDWKKVLVKEKCETFQQVASWLNMMNIRDQNVILFWNDKEIAAISINLQKIVATIHHIGERHLFLYCPTVEYVIEWIREKDLMIGLAPR